MLTRKLKTNTGVFHSYISVNALKFSVFCIWLRPANGASGRTLPDRNRPGWLDSSRSAGPSWSAGSSQEDQNLSGAVLVLFPQRPLPWKHRYIPARPGTRPGSSCNWAGKLPQNQLAHANLNQSEDQNTNGWISIYTHTHQGVLAAC